MRRLPGRGYKSSGKRFLLSPPTALPSHSRCLAIVVVGTPLVVVVGGVVVLALLIWVASVKSNKAAAWIIKMNCPKFFHSNIRSLLIFQHYCFLKSSGHMCQGVCICVCECVLPKASSIFWRAAAINKLTPPSPWKLWWWWWRRWCCAMNENSLTANPVFDTLWYVPYALCNL